MGIMIRGRLEQLDTPRSLYYHPVSMEVARFFGPVCAVPLDSRHPAYARPERITLVPDADGPGVVTDHRFDGVMNEFCVAVGDGSLMARSVQNGISVGDAVRIEVEETLWQEV
jgi:ABC-type Fe3+/spermidine/putrescine transport system ATPase subunit